MPLELDPLGGLARLSTSSWTLVCPGLLPQSRLEIQGTFKGSLGLRWGALFQDYCRDDSTWRTEGVSESAL